MRSDAPGAIVRDGRARAEPDLGLYPPQELDLAGVVEALPVGAAARDDEPIAAFPAAKRARRDAESPGDGADLDERLCVVFAHRQGSRTLARLPGRRQVGDESRFTGFLDDLVGIVPYDDALDLRIGVARDDDEQARPRPHELVFADRQGDALCALLA